MIAKRNDTRSILRNFNRNKIHCRVRSDFPNPEYQSIWSAFSIVHVISNKNDTRSILSHFNRNETYQSSFLAVLSSLSTRHDFPNSECQSIWSAFSIVHLISNRKDTRSILSLFNRYEIYQSSSSAWLNSQSTRYDFPNPECQSIWSAFPIVHVIPKRNDTRSILSFSNRYEIYQSSSSAMLSSHSARCCRDHLASCCASDSRARMCRHDLGEQYSVARIQWRSVSYFGVSWVRSINLVSFAYRGGGGVIGFDHSLHN